MKGTVYRIVKKIVDKLLIHGWTGLVLLVILTIVALSMTHNPCFYANNEPSDFGKIGWVATLTAAICSMIGLMCVLFRANDIIERLAKELKTSSKIRWSSLLAIVSAVTVVAIGIGLGLSHDPCFNGTVAQRSAWILTTAAILVQIFIIGALLSAIYDHKAIVKQAMDDKYEASIYNHPVRKRTWKKTTFG